MGKRTLSTSSQISNYRTERACQSRSQNSARIGTPGQVAVPRQSYNRLYDRVGADASTGERWLENTKGGVIHLDAKRKGLAVSLGVDGVVIDLK